MMTLKKSNEILDKWEASVAQGVACPFCGILKEHPVSGEPHSDDCPVLTAIARQETAPAGKGRSYI